MNNDESRERKITELTALLEELEINQRRISSDINTVKGLVQELSSQVDTTTKHRPKKEQNKQRGIKPNIGDIVTVVNAKRNQPHTGVVVGFTLTGYVKVRGSNGDIIRRLPINLIITSEK
jgi:hypothetical protein